MCPRISMRGLVHWSVCLSGLREFCAPTFERKYSEGSTSELVTSEHHRPLSARLLSALYMNKRTLSACGIPRSLKSLHRVILTLRLIFLEMTRATTLRIGALDSFFHCAFNSSTPRKFPQSLDLPFGTSFRQFRDFWVVHSTSATLFIEATLKKGTKN